jgi:hypothetical protein
VLATVAGAHTLALSKGGADTVSALAGGYHYAWLVGAATVLVTLGIVLSTLRSQQPAATEPVEVEVEVA